MVVYDLACSRGHSFEGWFKDLKDLSAQIARRLLTCPICGDEQIHRRPSTFGLVRTAGRPEASPADKPAEDAAPSAAAATLEMFQRWAEFSQRLEREFDDVGRHFADEALKMHYGVSKRRGIRGLSTAPQEEMLRKEGIEFFKVPLLTRKNYPSTN